MHVLKLEGPSEKLRQMGDRKEQSTIGISCRIFEHFALQMDPVTEFIKLRSTLCKEGATLVPKLVNLLPLWTSGSTPFSKLDSVNLIWINSYSVLYKDVS
jgi:hypothetical protein